MNTDEVLIKALKEKIKEANHLAEEYAQEMEDSVTCEIYLAKAHAYQEIIDLIINTKGLPIKLKRIR